MIALPSVALAGVMSWASGFRLYAALFIAGMLEHFHLVVLPAKLEILAHTPVLVVTGVLLVIEFLVDKVPAVDSVWDSVQTFVRVPLGALLAWGVFANASTETQTVAAILGGALAAGTHVAKAGTRAVVNTSPEPLSNWSLSFSEDGVLLLGMWLAFKHPAVFVVLLVLFALLLVWLIPKLWRGLMALKRGFQRLFTVIRSAVGEAGTAGTYSTRKEWVRSSSGRPPRRQGEPGLPDCEHRPRHHHLGPLTSSARLRRIERMKSFGNLRHAAL